MRRLLISLFAFLVVFTTGSAQALQAGNLAGLHVMTVHLKPGVTTDQFRGFFVGKVLPEYEKAWPGLHAYLLKAFSPKNPNQFAVVWVFRSVAHRNEYFTPGDKANEKEHAAQAVVKPIEDELKAKYGDYTVTYTNADDWVVQ